MAVKTVGYKRQFIQNLKGCSETRKVFRIVGRKYTGAVCYAWGEKIVCHTGVLRGRLCADGNGGWDLFHFLLAGVTTVAGAMVG